MGKKINENEIVVLTNGKKRLVAKPFNGPDGINIRITISEAEGAYSTNILLDNKHVDMLIEHLKYLRSKEV